MSLSPWAMSQLALDLASDLVCGDGGADDGGGGDDGDDYEDDDENGDDDGGDNDGNGSDDDAYDVNDADDNDDKFNNNMDDDEYANDAHDYTGMLARLFGKDTKESGCVSVVVGCGPALEPPAGPEPDLSSWL